MVTTVWELFTTEKERDGVAKGPISPATTEHTSRAKNPRKAASV